MEAACERAMRDEHAARVREPGYTIVENAIEPDLSTLARGPGPPGARARRERRRQRLRGRRTVRIYNLLAHGAPFDGVPVHASVLPIVEGVLDPGA